MGDIAIVMNTFYDQRAKNFGTRKDGTAKHPRTREREKIVRSIRRDRSRGTTAKLGAAATNESLLRHTIQEALKRKFSPLKEEVAPTQLYQVVLVLSIEKPIKDIAGKLNKIRSIEGVTIVSHEPDDDVVHRGDVVAKVKFMPKKASIRPMTYVKQVLEPSINSSNIVPEVKVLQVVHGTIKEI